MAYIDIAITQEMLETAHATVECVRVNRTVASPYDTLAGILGEMAVAQWFLGDWRRHDLVGTKGRPDILDRIEVKTSAYPFRDTLNLLVREDYAAARRPECYVQVIIDIPTADAQTIEAGTICRISGWATSDEVDQAPLRDFGAKGGGRGGYRCRYIQIRRLRNMDTFPIAGAA